MTPSPILGLLGISASSLVTAFLNAITHWLEEGSAAIVSGVGTALDQTTSVSFGSGFLELYGSMRTIGGAVALPFLLAATIQALLRQDAASLVRTLLVRAPAALIGSGIAIWLVHEGLVITDAFSKALLTEQDSSGAHFTSNLVTLLVGTNSVLTGSEGVLLALVTAAAAFTLWIELVIRSSAVLCASLFIPLALAGVIWPITSHWIRRLAETLAALILAKVAMCAVLVLGILSLEHPSGVSGVIEGVAILLLSSFAPFAMLRLLPFIEQGATSHLAGIPQRAAQAAMSFDGDRLRHPFGGGSNGAGTDLTPQRDPVPWMSAEPVDNAAFERTYADVLGEFEAVARSRRAAESDRGEQ